MTKEKTQSLQRYVQALKDRLTAPVPAKHKSHPESYHNFLRNEIEFTTNTLEAAKAEAMGAAAK